MWSSDVGLFNLKSAYDIPDIDSCGPRFRLQSYKKDRIRQGNRRKTSRDFIAVTHTCACTYILCTVIIYIYRERDRKGMMHYVLLVLGCPFHFPIELNLFLNTSSSTCSTINIKSGKGLVMMNWGLKGQCLWLLVNN